MEILFCDWNGTLLDDTKIWERAIKTLFKRFDKKPPTATEYFTLLEKTGDYLDVYRALGITASREELNQMYETEYKKISSEANLFPDVIETLAILRESGVVLSLVTMQPAVITNPALKHFGIEHLFKYLDFHVLDKKSVVARIVADEKANPNKCYFIGDAPSDMRHAKASGVQAVAFLNEHVPHELMRATRPDHYVLSFSEVLKFL